MSGPRRVRGRIKTPLGMSRRFFLQRAAIAAGATAALPMLSACGSSNLPVANTPAMGVNPPPALVSPFKHGVASGDPLSDRVILWTRVTPVSNEDIPVLVKVFTDLALTNLLDTRQQTATAARDWTIKIDFTGLQAGTTYYYQFEAVGFKSVMGRTKTAPTSTERLRLGVVSCSSYAHGVFNAYRMLAKRADIDAVLHLGDYIYEYATGQYGNARPYEPATEMISLADIRERHAYYKRTDVDLQEVHRQHPFITVWDDHETTNDSYTNGAENHTEGAPPTGEGNWPQRKAWGQQAYDEWMPIRLPEAGNPNKIWRTLPYGDLVELIMLDTRLFSRSQPTSLTAPTANTIAADPTRSLLGNEQRLFLEDRLKNSPARWKVVGQQVMVAPFKLAPGINGAAGGGQYFNYDQWDGYQADRSKLFNFMRSNSLNNVVILTGDIHSSWAHDLTEDPNNPAVYNPGVIANGTVVSASTGSVGVEYVVPSVTSPGFEQIPGFSNADESVLAPNPHLKYFDGTRRGYCVMDITPARFQCEWWYVPQIATRADAESFGAAWKCDHNSKRQSPSTVSAPVMGAAGLAP